MKPEPPPRPSVAVPLLVAQTLLGLAARALDDAQDEFNAARNDPRVSSDRRAALGQRVIELSAAVTALDKPTRLGHAGWRKTVDEYHRRTQPWRYHRSEADESAPSLVGPVEIEVR